MKVRRATGRAMGIIVVAKWETCIFKLALDNGATKIVCAPAYKGLGLMKVKKGTWRLIHLISGNGLVSLEGDYFTIRKISVDIADLVDWSDLKTAEEIRAVAGIHERIEAIIRSWMGEDKMEAGHA